MNVRILEDAKRDLLLGYWFCEEQSPGLGACFLATVFSDIESLVRHGGIHGVRHGCYRCLTTRYPFAIYYRIVGVTAHVIAVVDCRRSPSWIRRRLGRH